MLERVARVGLSKSEVMLYTAEMVSPKHCPYPIPLQQLLQLCGLSNLHSTGIIHRDIKLENILFDAHGHIVITDFGLAHKFDPEKTRIDDVLIDGIAGTVGYWAPEMVFTEQYSWEVDIWAMGMVIFEMAAHKTTSFYWGKTLHEIQWKMKTFNVPIWHVKNPDLEDLLTTVSS